MTGLENERLGVVEVEVGHIKSVVAEIKADVKTLVSAQQQIALDLATRNAAEVALAKSRVSTGVWLRFFTERGLALLALGASVYAILKG